MRSFTICAVAMALSEPVWADDRLVGVYEGVIFSGVEQPGTTEFRKSPSGDITGTYTYGTGDQAETGALVNCRLIGREMSCVWRDIDGEGDFIVRFSDDFYLFNGGWYEDVNETGIWRSGDAYTWYGVRQGSGPEPVDRDQS